MDHWRFMQVSQLTLWELVHGTFACLSVLNRLRQLFTHPTRENNDIKSGFPDKVIFINERLL
jgi:hypothetical protein